MRNNGSVESGCPIEHWPRPGESASAAPATMSWPARTKALFGLLPEATVSRDVFESLVHPGDLQRFDEAHASALAAQSGGVDICYRVRRADDGAERWMRFRGRIDGEATAGRLVGSVEDITAERVIGTASL